LEELDIGTLPQNLNEAVNELDKDELFRETLGAEIVDEFIKLKRTEWIEYQLQVSDWERERYMEFF
jgi:glutamine synthetase